MSEEIKEYPFDVKFDESALKTFNDLIKEKGIRHFKLESDLYGILDVVSYEEYEKLQQKVEQLEKENKKLNNIIDELEKWLNEYYKSNRKWYNTELSNHDKQYYEEIYRNTEFMIVKFLKQLKELEDNK